MAQKDEKMEEKKEAEVKQAPAQIPPKDEVAPKPLETQKPKPEE